jgi:hypothetical protein
MFPPKPSPNPTEWLNGLWSSLQRASDYFGEDGHIERGSDGSVRARSRMLKPLTKDIKPVVLAYIKQYSKACGWNVKVKFEKGYCLLEAASRAESSASKKA